MGETIELIKTHGEEQIRISECYNESDEYEIYKYDVEQDKLYSY